MAKLSNNKRNILSALLGNRVLKNDGEEYAFTHRDSQRIDSSTNKVTRRVRVSLFNDDLIAWDVIKQGYVITPAGRAAIGASEPVTTADETHHETRESMSVYQSNDLDQELADAQIAHEDDKDYSSEYDKMPAPLQRSQWFTYPHNNDADDLLAPVRFTDVIGELATLRVQLAAANARIAELKTWLDSANKHNQNLADERDSTLDRVAELTIDADMVDSQDCPVCDGTGRIDDNPIGADRCVACSGKGKVSYAFLAGYYSAKLISCEVLSAHWQKDAREFLAQSKSQESLGNHSRAAELRVLHNEIANRVIALEWIIQSGKHEI